MRTETPPAPPRGASTAEVLRTARVGAVVAFALTACLVYALDRTAAAVGNPPFNPLAAVASARIDYFWRMPLAAFVGSLVGLGWGRAVGERAPAALRLLLRLVWPVVLLCATLSAVWP